MKVVHLIAGGLDAPERHEVEDLHAFIRARYPTRPESLRIYHRQVAASWDEATLTGDVTPCVPPDIARLSELPGPFWVVVRPQEPVTIGMFLLKTALMVAASFAVGKILNAIFPPSAPTLGRALSASSANNELAERTNRPRLGGRIEDIFGQVRSTPSLISPPYRVYENNREVEIALMAIGRGTYAVEDVRDGATLASTIEGASVEVYGPQTSPNSGQPQLRIGQPITEPLRAAKRCEAVNGQVLRPPNVLMKVDTDSVRFVGPNKVQLRPSSGFEWTSRFGVGDSFTIACRTAVGHAVPTTNGQWYQRALNEFEVLVLVPIGHPDGVEDGTVEGESRMLSTEGGENPGQVQIEWHFDPSGSTTYNLDGTYTIAALSATEVVLASPEAVNAGWASTDTTPRDTSYGTADFSSSGPRWVGPFVVDSDGATSLYANLVAPQGLYGITSAGAQVMARVVVQVEWTPLADDLETLRPGTVVESRTATITGSIDDRSERGVTAKFTPSAPGPWKVRISRTTPTNPEFDGTLVEEVRWRDLYGVSRVMQPHFGDVTTVYSVTHATTGALALKERRLNMLATRCVHRRGLSDAGPDETGAIVSGMDGAGFSRALLPTKRADDIFVAVARDPRIGNRKLDELDVDGIYDTIAAVESYFGIPDAAEFCATFDRDNLSYEETAAVIANAVFCQAHRRGSTIRLKLERETEDAVLLIGSGNRVPKPLGGGEVRSVGRQSDNDGLEVTWVDPRGDAPATIYRPEDRSAVNPRKVELVGVRNERQATLHADRLWAKLQYQDTALEVEVTQEGNILVVADRIFCADGTRPFVQDGAVVAQDGLTVTLSKDVQLDPEKAHTFLAQLPDGTVDAIPCEGLLPPGTDAGAFDGATHDDSYLYQ